MYLRPLLKFQCAIKFVKRADGQGRNSLPSPMVSSGLKEFGWDPIKAVGEIELKFPVPYGPVKKNFKAPKRFVIFGRSP